MTCVTRFFFSVYCWGHQTCKYLKEHIPVVHPLSLHCTQAGTHTHTYTHKPFSLNLISLVLKLLRSSTGQWPPTTYPEQSGQSLSMWVGRVTLSRVALAMAVGLKRGTPARHRCCFLRGHLWGRSLGAVSRWTAFGFMAFPSDNPGGKIHSRVFSYRFCQCETHTHTHTQDWNFVFPASGFLVWHFVQF